MDSVGEGEGGKIWENGIETCEMSCMKQKKKKKTVDQHKDRYKNQWRRAESPEKKNTAYVTK